jgi:hypothetical protein
MVPQHTQHVNLWTVWQPCFPDVSFDWPTKFHKLTVFFWGGGGQTHTHLRASKCMCTTNTTHLRGWNSTSETISQWLIKVCSKQLWLITRETKFLGQHGVDVCLLTQTHLRSGETFQMANSVCHHTDWLTKGCRTAILVRCGTDHYTVPIHSAGRVHFWVKTPDRWYCVILGMKYVWRTGKGGSGKSQGLWCPSLSPAMW